MTPAVELLDVSARDGLQNESRLFSLEEKLHLIRSVLSSGIKRLEVASFVHPSRVPQMADAEAVIATGAEAMASAAMDLMPRG